jgi:tetratricopeptide (TPR) repeat protein
MNVTISRCLFLAAALSFCAPALAQDEDEGDRAVEELKIKTVSQPVIAYEVPGASELRDAMRRIASRPNDSDALVDAGNAALLLGDPNAALNFFTRANAVQPASGRIKMGLATASVQTENPFEALRLFDEAVKLGISERAIAGERALAFDLLGNFGRAQQDYNLAKTTGGSDSLSIRQAISLSLMGKKDEGDSLLLPLLKRNVPSAWRARAFLLAARGDYKESVKVTQSFMDVRSAQQFERYLRQMPQLTVAQQAAAIHLGHFPANNIGRDNDAVRAVASSYPVQGATGSGRLVPSGAPLGPASNNGKVAKESNKERKAREKAEKLAAKQAKNNPASSAVKAASNEPFAAGNGPGLVTDIARSRVLEAEKASVRLVAINSLPPPDNVRPLVPAILPPESPKPGITASSAANTPKPDVPVFAEKPQVVVKPVPDVKIATVPPQPSFPPPAPPQPILRPQQVVPSQPVVSQPVSAPQQNSDPFAKPPAATQPASPFPVTTPSVTTARVAAQPVISQPKASLPPPSPNITPVAVNGPAQVITQPNTQPIKAAETQGSSTSPLPTPDVKIASANIPADAPAPAQDSVPAIANLPTASTEQVSGINDTPIAAVNVPDAPPASKPKSEPSFDLGAVVSSIEIPESEQQRSVVPVDLKKLKPAVPKTDAAETASLDKNKASTKTAVPENPSRYWVQVATGNVSAFSGDMRNYSRKYPELFKGMSGWSSPWSNVSRLVVGPFDDLKAAKKWDADFRKAGGNGFVWRSEKGVVVNPLKGK